MDQGRERASEGKEAGGGRNGGRQRRVGESLGRKWRGYGKIRWKRRKWAGRR